MSDMTNNPIQQKSSKWEICNIFFLMEAIAYVILKAFWIHIKNIRRHKTLENSKIY